VWDRRRRATKLARNIVIRVPRAQKESSACGDGDIHDQEFRAIRYVVCGRVRAPIVFAAAGATVIAWLLTGPFFSYSDSWQLIMNTWTGVATFLMVFLIQNSQNRDSSAIQAKLDELIRTSSARNTLVGIEKLTPEEIETIRRHIERLAARTIRDDSPHAQG
jgi:low affinity Fe/Cu permease